MSANYDLIKTAIATRQQVIATYNGYYRELCPHAIGWSQSGYEQALFFQFAGDSESGIPPEGERRCLTISDLSKVTLRPGSWHTGVSHSRPQTCVARVDLEIQL